MKFFNAFHARLFLSSRAPSVPTIIYFYWLKVTVFSPNVSLSTKKHKLYFATFNRKIVPLDRSRIPGKFPKLVKPLRVKPGRVEVREIRNYQRTTPLLLSKAELENFVRDLGSEIKSDLCFKPREISARQEAAEAHAVKRFQYAVEATIHAKRKTTNLKDITIVKKFTE